MTVPGFAKLLGPLTCVRTHGPGPGHGLVLETKNDVDLLTCVRIPTDLNSGLVSGNTYESTCGPLMSEPVVLVRSGLRENYVDL